MAGQGLEPRASLMQVREFTTVPLARWRLPTSSEFSVTKDCLKLTHSVCIRILATRPGLDRTFSDETGTKRELPFKETSLFGPPRPVWFLRNRQMFGITPLLHARNSQLRNEADSAKGRNIVVVSFIKAHPFSDWLREALKKDLVSDWLLRKVPRRTAFQLPACQWCHLAGCATQRRWRWRWRMAARRPRGVTLSSSDSRNPSCESPRARGLTRLPCFSELRAAIRSFTLSGSFLSLKSDQKTRTDYTSKQPSQPIRTGPQHAVANQTPSPYQRPRTPKQQMGMLTSNEHNAVPLLCIGYSRLIALSIGMCHSLLLSDEHVIVRTNWPQNTSDLQGDSRLHLTSQVTWTNQGYNKPTAMNYRCRHSWLRGASVEFRCTRRGSPRNPCSVLILSTQTPSLVWIRLLLCFPLDDFCCAHLCDLDTRVVCNVLPDGTLRVSVSGGPDLQVSDRSLRKDLQPPLASVRPSSIRKSPVRSNSPVQPQVPTGYLRRGILIWPDTAVVLVFSRGDPVSSPVFVPTLLLPHLIQPTVWLERQACLCLRQHPDIRLANSGVIIDGNVCSDIQGWRRYQPWTIVRYLPAGVRLDSLSGRPDLHFPRFPEITAGECRDASFLKDLNDSFHEQYAPSLITGTGMIGQGMWEIPEKTRRPTTSSGTIPTCENPVNRPGIEPGSPRCEERVLIAQPPWPRKLLANRTKSLRRVTHFVAARNLRSAITKAGAHNGGLANLNLIATPYSEAAG
ncbi:hypothetical protein PR048_016673 [Dryococelus australis]|uniref:Uncharacterized protein n=1 Tax=Dryococelus australis TaxID=614101 RepID=A0ABQ9H7F8_9NEOP|nr:hypothetical protein PR048_016673 [Dryococelus australis]